MGKNAIGRGVSRFEDDRLLRGGGSYVDDIQLANMAYGALVRSPYGHAKIKSIDVSAARAAPGVLAVITADDWSAAGLGDLPSHSHAGLKRRGGVPLYVPKYPVLAGDRVRWVGDPLVFIVAETMAQAIDAQELVSAEYQQLDAIISTSQAMNSDGPRVYDDCDNNVCFVECAGNKAAVVDAFANAQHIVKHRFVINRVTAAPMEPRGVVAYYDGSNGRFIVHTATQRPHTFRAQLAQILRSSRGPGAHNYGRYRRQLWVEITGVQRGAARLLRFESNGQAG